MNDNNKKKIKFSEKKDNQKIIYEVGKLKEEKTYTADDKKTTKTFKNVSGNNWFIAKAEWRNVGDSEWKTKIEYKLGFWGLVVAIGVLILGGIIAWVRSRNKKKSLNEEKFL